MPHADVTQTNTVKRFIYDAERIWNHVAHVLHDTSMQPLASAQLQLEMLKSTLADHPDSRHQIERIQQALREANQNLRDLFTEMDSQAITEQGLDHALADFIEYLRRQYPTGPPIAFSASNYQDGVLTTDIKKITFRCLQRLLLEVMNSGNPQSEITVELRREQGHAVGLIHCAGGTRVQEGIWREWLHAVGGELKLESFHNTNEQLQIEIKVPFV
jgi:nitrate/nitrite-specific signal transduction histidine kinase